MSTHSHDLSPWQHSHVFDTGNQRGEARTRWVLALTLVTMAVEIGAGWWSGSMALLADGWHMGTHALALGVTAAAYALARRHARDPRYSFGTWKIEVLGAYSSALVLGIVALGIGLESALRLWQAEPIDARVALWVAIGGLLVNLASAALLHGAEGHGHDHGNGQGQGQGHGHGHGHGQGHGDDHGHDHHGHGHGHGTTSDRSESAPAGDLNLRAAYMHVLADALTSVLAIAALSAALWLGWWWLDPVVGLVGAVVIAVWSVGLLRQSSAVLLDREMDLPLAQAVRRTLESDGDARVADLHVWRVGRDQFAAIASIVADAPLSPGDYRARLAVHPELAHVSLEVNACPNAGR